MKKLSKIALLATFLVASFSPAWGQASTQGKEFWVSSTLVCSPDKDTATPYIAISAEKACTVTIQGGVGNAINITQNVAAGSWSEFGNPNKAQQTNPLAGPVCVNMDATKWYPTNMNNANNVSSLAGQKNMYGLHVSATENISVYVILASKHSMDASNILPITALGSEYYTQDYWSKVKSDFPDAVGLTTILGTEDGTRVDIIPNGDTFDGHRSGQLYTIDLNKGQTYYMVTTKGERLAGTHIQAQNDRKIAVFCGVPITNVPTGVAARDCLFEQSMPVQYWGTQFIATRSLEKNGNLIGITATQPRTEIRVDKTLQATIGAGETYYIMLQAENDPNGKAPGDSPIDLVLTADVTFIETSCPCAVYSYDTGNSYRGRSGDEVVNGQGDPSSVWVSPIQQKINKITFGTCYTDKTKDHFLNVVTETATCNNTTLTAIFGANTIDKTNLLNWIPVPGTKYSYARAKIGDANTSNYSVFRLENKKGFIATVYGNGEDESYAYSAGSAAVEQGVNVNGETFVDGYRSDSRFCINSDLSFEAVGGADEILRVDWDFGDGTSATTEGEDAAKTSHVYTSRGWYDVSAVLYGRQVCTDEPEQLIGEIAFTFRIVRADTIYHEPKKECVQEDYRGELFRFDTTTYDCDSVVIDQIYYKRNTSYKYDLTAQDIAYVNDQAYTTSQLITWTIENHEGCDSVITCNLRIVKCLDLQITNDSAHQVACFGDVYNLPFSYDRDGAPGKAYIIINKQKTELDLSNASDEGGRMVGTVALPVNQLKPGRYTATVQVEDRNCQTTAESPLLDIAVLYPSDIFALKYNNVLAVYKKGFGGNSEYEFTAYQWFHNDEAIEGATESVYHTAEAFTPEDTYYVLLTDKDGMTLPSCAITIPGPDDQGYFEPAEPAAMKALINRRLYIRKGDLIYDIYGQRVQ